MHSIINNKILIKKKVFYISAWYFQGKIKLSLAALCGHKKSICPSVRPSVRMTSSMTSQVIAALLFNSDTRAFAWKYLNIIETACNLVFPKISSRSRDIEVKRRTLLVTSRRMQFFFYEIPSGAISFHFIKRTKITKERPYWYVLSGAVSRRFYYFSIFSKYLKKRFLRFEI